MASYIQDKHSITKQHPSHTHSKSAENKSLFKYVIITHLYMYYILFLGSGGRGIDLNYFYYSVHNDKENDHQVGAYERH